ncbi:alpha/beta fold hydrolase [Pseudonocardia spinosispora]|uniref:alpha/beta fold hydrolase n=1 Tax=Pseudonocardia spinosispora TaxID=103441 RepID=UPI000413E3C9|nr:alpha/beta fold hydrolase [Pseudonocardia spinosispora]
MTSVVLVHGAWHGAWAWERVEPLLTDAGVRVVTPDLARERDVGLHDHVEQVLGSMPDDELVLVGHSYAGLVVRQAADARPDRVKRIVLIDGWAGPDGSSMANLTPDWFMPAMHAAAGDDQLIPAPPPAAFGITEPRDSAWLAHRLGPHPLRTFTEETRLSGAVEDIPAVAVCATPSTLPFARLAQALGYPIVPVTGPHDVMLTDPHRIADLLLPDTMR